MRGISISSIQNKSNIITNRYHRFLCFLTSTSVEYQDIDQQGDPSQSRNWIAGGKGDRGKDTFAKMEFFQSYIVAPPGTNSCKYYYNSNGTETQEDPSRECMNISDSWELYPSMGGMVAGVLVAMVLLSLEIGVK